MFKVLIVVSFILHILFVNLTVAGSVYALYMEFKGIWRKDKRWDDLALEIATQVSIHKSIAVVLGVAPLLIISTIYTQFFFPSTLLIGKWWLLLIPLLIGAFLSLYVYKFTWKVWQNRKGLHTSFGLFGSGLLLFVPLIFIVNVVSMLYPEMWQGSKGFIQSLFYYPSIWQRYMHFLFASMALMGGYLYWWGNKHLKQDSQVIYQLAKDFGKRAAFLFTTVQMLFGPFVLFSLDPDIRDLYLGASAFHTAQLSAAILLVLLLIGALFLLMQKGNKRWFRISFVLFFMAIGMMGWLRHEVRDLYLNPYFEEHPRTLSESAANR